MIGCRRALVAPALVAVLAAPAMAAPDAKAIYAKSCAPCHGRDGAPSPVFAKQGVRSFRDAAWQKSVTDAQLERSILEGKKGTMMASFKDAFSPEEIKALVKYVRTLAPEK